MKVKRRLVRDHFLDECFYLLAERLGIETIRSPQTSAGLCLDSGVYIRVTALCFVSNSQWT